MTLISTPNVAFFPLRVSHLMGRFAYAERGILDVTHKRLFTLDSLLTMVADCGFVVEKVVPIGAPFALVLRGTLGQVAGKLAATLARVWPRGFAFQFLVVTRPMPGVACLLERADRIPIEIPSHLSYDH